MNATIKLFKALEISSKKTKQPSKNLLKETIKYGIVFSPQVIYNYEENELIKIAKDLGSSSEQLNNSFHKSWKKVANSSIEQLFLEQIIHYFTTYGLESVDAYSKDTVFIPAEKLDAIKNDIELIVIKGYTKKELKEKLLALLETGIALSEETINDVVEVAKLVELDKIDSIKNKEVKIILGSKLHIIPENPIEFLRLLVYTSTKKTLIIKNKKIINDIKEYKEHAYIGSLLIKYDKKYGYEKLSEIFYRYKPLFLAFKQKKPQLSQIINKIRKLAVKNHKPMKEDYLNNITANITRINKNELQKELDEANIFRKIRLAYALKFRTREVSSILYKIRNGKSYATSFEFDKQSYAKKIYEIVIASIVKDLKVKGKKIYIPEYINYALPATEKQFTGVFPSGTYITIPNDMIVGVHWENVKHNRIDLDLSMINMDGKVGWDGYWRDSNSSVLFSGDMTDAQKPNGASEFLYVKRQTEKSYIINLNYYNYKEETEVPFQIIVAKEKPDDFKHNYTVNPNNILTLTNTKINQKQKILGLLVVTSEGSKFYFAETYIGNNITSSGRDYVIHSKNYLYDYYRNTINLNELLVQAGAKIVEDKTEADIDLSPQSLEKDTIINLLLNQ